MQLVRFLLVGVLNTGIGLACIFGAMWLLGLDYRLANVFGYAVGCGVSFLLHRSWTFRHDGPWFASLVRWLAIVAVSYGVNLLTLVFLHERLGVNAYLAQIGGTAAYTFVSFVGARHLAFRDRTQVHTAGAIT